MLVLTRKVEEKLQIGANITITVLRVKGRAVKIGVEAPQGVQVLRGELLRQTTARETPPGGCGGSEAASTTDPTPSRESSPVPGDAPSDAEADSPCDSPPGPFLPKRRALRQKTASQEARTTRVGPALPDGSPRPARCAPLAV